LARFVNSILLGLNELRRCLLPGVVGRLKTALKGLLEDVHKDLIAHERAVHVPGLQKGPQTTQLRHVAVRYKDIVSTIVEPYVWGSLHAAIGDMTAAQSQYEILQANLQPPAPQEQEEKEDEKAEESSNPEEAAEEEEDATNKADSQDGQDVQSGGSTEKQAEVAFAGDSGEKETED